MKCTLMGVMTVIMAVIVGVFFLISCRTTILVLHATVFNTLNLGIKLIPADNKIMGNNVDFIKIKEQKQ